MADNLVAKFSLNDENLQANFNINETTIPAVFRINTNLEVIGEGVIKVTTENGKAVVVSTTFTFEQGLPAKTWTIVHNLNKKPSVFAVDSAGMVQIPNEIIYDSENQITITFLAGFAGKAYLN